MKMAGIRECLCNTVDMRYEVHRFLPNDEILEMLGHTKPRCRLGTGNWVPANPNVECA